MCLRHRLPPEQFKVPSQQLCSFFWQEYFPIKQCYECRVTSMWTWQKPPTKELTCSLLCAFLEGGEWSQRRSFNSWQPCSCLPGLGASWNGPAALSQPPEHSSGAERSCWGGVCPLQPGKLLQLQGGVWSSSALLWELYAPLRGSWWPRGTGKGLPLPGIRTLLPRELQGISFCFLSVCTVFGIFFLLLIFFFVFWQNVIPLR